MSRAGVAEQATTGAPSGAKATVLGPLHHAGPIKWVCSPCPQLIPYGGALWSLVSSRVYRLSGVVYFLLFSSYPLTVISHDYTPSSLLVH
jgi:hypothetical protein